MVNQDEKDGKIDDMEFILKDIGGAFGKFQIFNLILILLAIGSIGSYTLDYVFTTLNVDYRCLIPECDTAENIKYNPIWLENAVPFKNSRPEKCYRFQPLKLNRSDHKLFYTNNELNGHCDKTSFNQSMIIKCPDDNFIYRTDEISIVNEFNITCKENAWKLGLVGVISSTGRFIFMPIFGHLSDRFGRKVVLIICLFVSSIFKILKTFAPTYDLFLFLEFIDGGALSSAYAAALILTMEWASIKRRILVSCVVVFSYPIGNALMGLVASYTHNYKWTLRIISVPGLLIITYIWLAHESLRWLLLQRRYETAIKTVNYVSKINKIQVSQKTLDIIFDKCQIDKDNRNVSNSIKDRKSNDQLKTIFKSRQLILRLVICMITWVVGAFVGYGISIISVSLQGDKYTNFIVVSLGGVPSVFLTYFMLTYMGRRYTMCISLLIAGFSIIASTINGYPTVSLILFFIAKCFIHHAFTVLYVYTSELWPTSVRHSVLSICSMIGRIGSLLAPLTPLLTNYMETLPHLLFSGSAFLSGLLILFLPETFNTQLPDTFEELKQ